MKEILHVGLVPESAWYFNVRSILSVSEWDKIRKIIYQKADYKCEICGGQGYKHLVEAHERWQYDEKKHIQKLVNIVALCPVCHEATHIGFAGLRHKTEQSIQHIMKVNKWDRQQTLEHIKKAFDIWKDRSKIEWKLDLTYFLEQNFDLLESTKRTIKNSINKNNFNKEVLKRAY
ncbi:MAG: HNH endonuclease [Minisyncoccia bacterium]